MDIQKRFAIAHIVREEYESFEDFALEGMKYLGFDLTDMQADIAEFMQNGPRLRMVMAQRGEAKSTLAALYAVWRIVQDPRTRVLIISAGEDKASEVASVVIKLIMHWDILEYLRPDKRAGDRTSVDAFDVHYALKGLDQSPTVSCIGITSNLQGRRADLLIPDDIESTKNGLTVTQRSHLLLLTKEFTSINTHGDILYLGTPQTKDSIYNTLPGRGFQLRVWPGRYPNADELEKYGERLAPFVRDKLVLDPTLQSGGGIDGSRGKPTDPKRFNEDALLEKELDQGPEGFQLQYMLDTSLVDAQRQQLRLSDLLVADFDAERLPEVLVWKASRDSLVELPNDFPVTQAKMYHPTVVQCEWVPRPKEAVMYIDPAGGGSDELAFAVSTALGPYIHVLDVGGLKGGLTDENGHILCDVVEELGVVHIQVESNMGHGLFEINLRAYLEKRKLKCGVAGEYSTGQKERRIIDSLVGGMQRHKVVLHRRVFESDVKYNKQHSQDKRTQYSVFYQLANITTDRNSLVKDDRLEAMAGAVRHWKHVLALDEEKAAQARREADAAEFINNPMGYPEQRRHEPKGVRRRIYARR